MMHPIRIIARQVFWGFVFIPSGVWLVNVFFENWISITKLIKKQIIKKDSVDRLW